MPSGVNASTGEVEGPCVEARVTVTFQQPKVGLWLRPGKAHAGRVDVVDIGIPMSEPDAPPPPPNGLIRSSVLELAPLRSADGNKFASGSALVVGGSAGLTGAVCLACEAAMRAGAGWVRAGVPASLNEIFEVKLTEVMTLPLPDSDGHLAGAAAEQVVEACERADAVALGPGLGRAKEAFAVARGLIEQIDRPLVVDADGLNALAKAGIELAAKRAQPTVLTPHSGELARLLGSDSKQVEANRLASAAAAAERAGAVVVLKGDDTIVFDGTGGRFAVSRGGSSALATAGTGDVLTGVTTALLARGLPAFEAACLAVRAHAGAGRIAAEQGSPESVIAGDVVAALPTALHSAA
jgi:NAD(P)H-hydrate epimerase